MTQATALAEAQLAVPPSLAPLVSALAASPVLQARLGPLVTPDEFVAPARQVAGKLALTLEGTAWRYALRPDPLGMGGSGRALGALRFLTRSSEIEAMRAAGGEYSKRPRISFEDDSQRKQHGATAKLRRAVDLHLAPVHDRLASLTAISERKSLSGKGMALTSRSTAIVSASSIQPLPDPPAESQPRLQV